MEKEQKLKVALFVLAILLVFAIIYISVSFYQRGQAQKQIVIYNQGIQLGYQQAVTQLMQQAMTCQQVPVSFQNQTINLIAVECLQ